MAILTIEYDEEDIPQLNWIISHIIDVIEMDDIDLSYHRRAQIERLVETTGKAIEKWYQNCGGN